MGELYEQKAIPVVTSRADQAHSAITGVTSYDPYNKPNPHMAPYLIIESGSR